MAQCFKISCIVDLIWSTRKSEWQKGCIVVDDFGCPESHTLTTTNCPSMHFSACEQEPKLVMPHFSILQRFSKSWRQKPSVTSKNLHSYLVIVQWWGWKPLQSLQKIITETIPEWKFWLFFAEAITLAFSLFLFTIPVTLFLWPKISFQTCFLNQNTVSIFPLSLLTL